MLPNEFKQDFPIYFKKSLLEIESEWNIHKKIIHIESKKGGVRKQIPKSLFLNQILNIFWLNLMMIWAMPISWKTQPITTPIVITR